MATCQSFQSVRPYYSYLAVLAKNQHVNISIITSTSINMDATINVDTSINVATSIIIIIYITNNIGAITVAAVINSL